ncbi:MAG: lycopene cyclase domain-containing protein [Micrococcales bacterium]
MSYLILNLVFTAVAFGVYWPLRKKLKLGAVARTMAVLVFLTAIFDNAIVGFGIVAYDPSQILGWRIGYAPIEDFGYAVVAAFLVPAIFKFFGPRSGGEK